MRRTVVSILLLSACAAGKPAAPSSSGAGFGLTGKVAADPQVVSFGDFSARAPLRLAREGSTPASALLKRDGLFVLLYQHDAGGRPGPAGCMGIASGFATEVLSGSNESEKVALVPRGFNPVDADAYTSGGCQLEATVDPTSSFRVLSTVLWRGPKAALVLCTFNDDDLEARRECQDVLSSVR
jgi:hypothetical protein